MWALGSLTSALRFHSPLGFPWTLTLFGPIAYLWLQKEILYYRDRAPLRIFESAGKGSYSIYLTHPVAAAMFVSLPLSLGATAHWFAQLAFTLLVCSVFYFGIEKPSHMLARKLAERLSAARSTDELPPATEPLMTVATTAV
jgi:peptidoglycan/LPS O-acetylase OafA/YrhL